MNDYRDRRANDRETYFLPIKLDRARPPRWDSWARPFEIARRPAMILIPTFSRKTSLASIFREQHRHVSLAPRRVAHVNERFAPRESRSPANKRRTARSLARDALRDRYRAREQDRLTWS